MSRTINRYLHKYITSDLKSKMVFIAGPKQVGKTTLALSIGKCSFKKFAYLNWDNVADKKIIRQASWPANAKLIMLDELHKYSKWKSFIKGELDKNRNTFSFIITGSARLDIYRNEIKPYENIRSIELVRDLSSMEILSEILPTKVGAPLSINSLREDFEANHKTVSLWLDILERFYYIFRIKPFYTNIMRSKKRGKNFIYGIGLYWKKKAKN